MPEVILVRANQTCTACPSQWDARDADGRYWYLRFRHGRGTMGRDYLSDPLSFDVDGDGPDGEISLGEFTRRIGVTYAPDLAAGVTEWEEPPG